MRTLRITILFLSLAGITKAQFAPGLGFPGCTAIHKDSSVFVDWAQTVTLQRGPMQLGVDTLGNAFAGSDENALGRAGENPTVSLGDGGSAVLTFTHPLRNGPGFDFAVFENSFDGLFLELAFVEVSSDGNRFVRFPAHSLTDAQIGTGPFDYTEPAKIHNLAGKYPLFYGTPFDLEDVKDSSGIDVNWIRFVRVVDVVGAVTAPYATYDAYGNMVADPWPTPFPGSGFDLDAVGVIHQDPSGFEKHAHELLLYPQPARDLLYVSHAGSPVSQVRIIDQSGRVVKTVLLQQTPSIDVSDVSAGHYFLELKLTNEQTVYKPCLIAR